MMKRQASAVASRDGKNVKLTPPFPTRQMFVLGMRGFGPKMLLFMPILTSTHSMLQNLRAYRIHVYFPVHLLHDSGLPNYR